MRHGVLLALWLFPLAAGAAARGYEEQLVAWGLAQQGREREEAPEGKRVEEILVSSEEIVAPTDPYPQLLNLVHIKTRPQVILKEVLLQVGAPYRNDLAEETERNLRKLPVLAIARVVPVKGTSPDGVGVLVVTKDLWSIRINSEFNFANLLLQRLRVRPSEQNFLGLNKALSLDFDLRLDTLSLGQAYSDRRLLGTFLTLTENAALIFNREDFRLEGSRGGVAFGLPLISLRSEWGYGLSAAWLVQRVRIFKGATVWQLPYPDSTSPTGEVPYIYDARSMAAAASLTRSFGDHYKTNVTAELGGYTRRYGAPPESPLTAEQRTWLASRYLPRSEDAIYLGASVQAFEARYQVLTNVQTFALSEDFQLGYSALLSLRWAEPALLSPSRFVEGGASARYRWLLGGDLLTVQAAAAARWVPGAAGTGTDGPWVNRHVALELHNVSPLLGPGRLMFRALVDLRADDLNHRLFLLGGGNGLRGVEAEQLVGPQMMLFNLEYRTLPINLWTLHAGLVLFADAGSAFVDRPALVYTVGVGLRALFPQFDVEPIRIDFGWVINGPASSWLNRFSASFGQVETYRPTFLDQPI